MVKAKTRMYAVTYLPKKKGFAVNRFEKGTTIKPQYKRNTSFIRSTSPSAALKKLSARSYKKETGRRL